MLKIHQSFFINFFVLLSGTALLASLISFFTLKSIIIHRYDVQLQNQLELLALQIHTVDDAIIQSKNIYRATNIRMTFIDSNGTVLSDSRTDKLPLENHGSRQEVIRAQTDKYGRSIRYSHTLQTDLLYVAKKITINDNTFTVRLALPLKKVLEDFYILWIDLLFIFLFFLLTALFLSYRMHIKIRYDIKQLTDFLYEISNKNYKKIVKIKYFSEFLEISLLLKNLIKKLKHRDKQKRKYTAKLRLINKQRTELLSALSHEIKNPIASILGYSETLQDELHDISAQQKKFLTKISSNADKITALLDRIALANKLENHDLITHPTYFDINQLITDVIAMMSKKYPQRTIIFTPSDKNGVTIYADETMIELVLINLIDNALKYSDDEVKVVILAQRLMVIDKGLGIEEEFFDKITTKYFRVESNTWDNSMGIGLAIVSEILKMHYTELSIQSRPKEGSIFSFEINTLEKHAHETKKVRTTKE